MKTHNKLEGTFGFKLLFFVLTIVTIGVVSLSSFGFAAQTDIQPQTYIDHVIVISENGESHITGSANAIISDIVPANDTLIFDTNQLTSKKGDYWTFTYQTTQPINVSLVKVQLPVGAVANYVHSSATTFIESGDAILLTFTDTNSPVNITVQYSFKIAPATKSTDFFSNENKEYGAIALGCALFIVLFGIGYVLVKKSKQKKNRSNVDSDSPSNGNDHSIDLQKLQTLKLTLNETQIKIIDALLARNGKATQNAIAHHTQIPKASLSRNVDLLVQKQILVKHASGYTNQLVFHESVHIAKKQ